MSDEIKQLPQYNDAIHVAAQLGRLDLVSVLLAAIAVLLALAGIYAFFSVKNSARIVARETAEEIAEKAANLYLQEKLPEIIDSYKDFIKGGVNQQIADRIAEAQENGTSG